mmetsp:Transcript_42178/g.68321  ORF Transcript_42178/g.68321 Transcript_42178/m.68321 type:complete len:119 (-) Transcript_42178:115-471(-)
MLSSENALMASLEAFAKQQAEQAMAALDEAMASALGSHQPSLKSPPKDEFYKFEMLRSNSSRSQASTSAESSWDKSDSSPRSDKVSSPRQVHPNLHQFEMVRFEPGMPAYIRVKPCFY